MGGTRFGEDFTEQATEPELKKLWSKWVKIDKEKQRRWDVENVSVRADLKLWANEERKRTKLETMQSWQAAKSAKLSGDAVTTTTKPKIFPMLMTVPLVLVLLSNTKVLLDDLLDYLVELNPMAHYWVSPA